MITTPACRRTEFGLLGYLSLFKSPLPAGRQTPFVKGALLSFNSSLVKGRLGGI